MNTQFSTAAAEQLQRYLQNAAQVQLAPAALLIASTQYPELDIENYLARLDELAERVQTQVILDRQHNMIRALNQVLFEEEGFAGNQSDYYDPRNSFLNDVMDRKSGIPITLSIVYLEVAQRLELPMTGISFPGHFLVKLDTGEDNIVVLDPFDKGTPLSENTLLEWLAKFQGEDYAEPQELRRRLQSATVEDILLRMLHNLKNIYLQQQAWLKLLQTMDLILAVAPNIYIEWRDRGIVYEKLECHRAAIQDIDHYLRHVPEAEDAAKLEDKIRNLQAAVRQIH